MPLYKKELMPRVGVAYSWDQKTVIRAGYGIFFIPNWVLFNLNPSNDPINTSSTLWVATTNSGLSSQQHSDGDELRAHPGRRQPRVTFRDAELPDQRAVRSESQYAAYQSGQCLGF